MRIAVYSAQPYDEQFLDEANAEQGHRLHFLACPLNRDTLAMLPAKADAVCVFVNDHLDAPLIKALAERGVRAIALRCAGYDNVDVPAANALGVRVVRVPAYSPESVAEHALALLMALLRHIPRAHARVRDGNFSLQGLLGEELHGKTVGLVGTGRIGTALARILVGCGCKVVATDPEPVAACIGLGVQYVSLNALLRAADIVSLHCPLNANTRHLVNAQTLAAMRPGVVVINTSRGAVVDTVALIEALKRGHVSAAGLDVYEGEAPLFFADRSGVVLQDEVFARLQGLPNVIVTAHQAFFTRQAMAEISQVTLANLTRIEGGEPCQNALC